VSFNDKEIFARIRNVLGRMLKISGDQIKLSSTIQDDLGIDSVDGLDMFFALEDEFQIKLGEKELEGLHSIADIVRLVERKTSSR